MRATHRRPSLWQRWRDRRAKSWAVKILHADGRVTECPVIRGDDPPGDHRRHWQVIIPANTVIGVGDRLQIARVVPGAALDAGIPVQRIAAEAVMQG